MILKVVPIKGEVVAVVVGHQGLHHRVKQVTLNISRAQLLTVKNFIKEPEAI